MGNFNFTEENKKELFENGCTFFDALGNDIISNLNHWDEEIRSLDFADSKCFNVCPMDQDKNASAGHQHWHTFYLQDELRRIDVKKYNQYREYIIEINDFFYDIPTQTKGPVSPTNIQISHYNDCFHSHRDGKEVSGNHASLLVYLNKNWKSEYGGELTVIGSDKKKYIHLPEFGSVALIDFSKNNPIHEVKKVKALNVQRVVMSTFFNKHKEGEYTSEQMDNY